MHADALPAGREPRLAQLRHDGGLALALHVAVSAFAGFVCSLLWGLTTGTGSAFWPKWVWFGLTMPVLFHVALLLAWRSTRGPSRWLAVHVAGSSVICVVLLTVWLLTDPAKFWPAIPVGILGLGMLAHLLGMAVLLQFDGKRNRVLQGRVDELTRTRRGALEVQAAELRRVERDLHDGAQSRLVALTMQLGRAEARAEAAEQPEIADLVRQARDEAGLAIAELRALARGIAPPVLADRGLAAAAEGLGQRTDGTVHVVSDLGDRRPPAVVETAAYFVVAEALTNAAKHAPGAAVEVRLALDEDELRVDVHDDGPGGADPDGNGLRGLVARVEALDGTLRLHSAQETGTTIEVVLPCGS